LQACVSGASSALTKYLRRVLAVETIAETFRRDRRGNSNLWVADYPHGSWNLLLKRYPIVSVASVVEDGATLDPSNYEFDAQSGRITRLSLDQFSPWRASKTVITYQAGYVLPPDTAATLPVDLHLAARRLASLFYRTTSEREPGLKSEIIPGVIEKQYWDQTRSGQADDDLPPDIRAMVDAYRCPL
jgi:hypothetical protein